MKSWDKGNSWARKASGRISKNNDERKYGKNGDENKDYTWCNDYWIFHMEVQLGYGMKDKLKIYVAEMSYLGSACGVQRIVGESNESLYNRFSISSNGEGMKCGVIEFAKSNTLIWCDTRIKCRKWDD